MPRVVTAGVPMRMPLATIGGVRVERNRVLVDGDARPAERRLGDLAREALREHVDEHQVVVGAAADQPEAGGGQTAPASRFALMTICCW